MRATWFAQFQKGTTRLLGLKYSQLQFLLVLKSVNKRILLNLSDKSVACHMLFPGMSVELC